MAWFTDDAVGFFRELELNNNREWFEANKKRYERSVKAPMIAFAGEIIERMRAIDPAVQMLPKDAVFRIFRDTRFSKDKTPYKTNAGLSVSRGGKTDPTSPGVYVHLDARMFGIASGCYFLEKEQLLAIRRHIVLHGAEFQSLLADAKFKETFGTVAGEKNKILPPEFKEAATAQPLLFNKQFYYWAEHAPEEALREDLREFVMRHLEAATPMNGFLGAALRGV